MNKIRRRMSPLQRKMREDLKLGGIADSSIETYVSAVRRLASHYGRSPAEITEDEVRSYLLSLSMHASSSTVRGNLAALKFLYTKTLGREWGLFDLVQPKRERKLPVVLGREEVWRILDCVHDPVYNACITMLYACGLRLQEGADLQANQIDGERMQVLVHGKGNRDRYVPLPCDALKMLRDCWRAHRSLPWLFPSLLSREKDDHPQPAGTRTLRTAFKSALKESGVRKKAHPHTLRHSYATHLHEEGVSLRLIQMYLGHASLRSTQIYTHLTRKVRETAKDPVNRLMAR